MSSFDVTRERLPAERLDLIFVSLRRHIPSRRMKLFLSMPFSFSRQTKSTLLIFQKSAFLFLSSCYQSVPMAACLDFCYSVHLTGSLVV
jgi:hypothetical protein